MLASVAASHPGCAEKLHRAERLLEKMLEAGISMVAELQLTGDSNIFDQSITVLCSKQVCHL